MYTRYVGRLGRTQVPVTSLALGTATLGNLFTAVTEDQARATVDAAWTTGVRSFDTAPHYGLGLSERRLGAALRDRPRNQYTLSTKVGRLLRQPRARPATTWRTASRSPPRTSACGTSAPKACAPVSRTASPGSAWTA